jgi:cytochrome c oxidase cbb3-type subunit III
VTRALLLAGTAALLLAACEREDRTPPAPARAARSDTIAVSSLQPGGASGAVRTRNRYEENAFAVSEGQRLFRQFNCSGCHGSFGGGGMGPPLMDDQWIYGSDPANIVATILEGRPSGMPSFRGKVNDDQVLQLAAYVRSLSGQLRKDVTSSRTDHMSGPSRSSPEVPKDSAMPPAALGQ